MSNLQYLPKARISSNSEFHDRISLIKEHEKEVKLKFEGDKNIQLNYNNFIHLKPHLAYKESLPSTYSSFDNARIQSLKTEEYFKQKRQIIEGKRKIIEKIVNERDRKIKEQYDIEKSELKTFLIRIIKDALKFSKECTPMISMMPNILKTQIENLGDDKITFYKNNNKSLNTLNLSNVSNYNKPMLTNSFLTELGLDLNNLTPDNIDIDIDRAYNFIKKWKVRNEDVNDVIRKKVVCEIMNVEERRSVRRIKTLEEKVEKCVNLVEKEKIRNFAGNPGLKKKSSINSNPGGDIENIGKARQTSYHKFNKRSLTPTSIRNKSSTRVVDSGKIIEDHDCMKNIYGSETVSSLPHYEKNKVREKCVLCKNHDKYQKVFKFNSYRNVDKIVKYINSHQTLRENNNLAFHFQNIKYTKNFDEITKKMMSENNLSIDSKDEGTK